MAAILLFCDSFDHYTLAQMSGKWTSGAGISFTDLIAGRTVNAYYTVGDTFITIPGGPRDNLTIGAFRIANSLTSTAFQLCVGLSGSQNASIQFNADGTVSALNALYATVATSTKVAIETNVGHYIELGVKCSTTTGRIIVRVDGEVLIDVENTNTGTSTYVASISGIGAGFVASYEDLYVTYDNTPGQISFYDDVSIQAISPNGAGSYSQWTPTSGLNWETVDEKPLSTTDYNETNVVNEIDTFTFPDLTFTGTVKGVQFVVSAKKSDVQIRAIQGVCTISGTDYFSANSEYLSTQESFYRFVWAVNPATSAAWTNSEVNSATFGYKLVV